MVMNNRFKKQSIMKVYIIKYSLDLKKKKTSPILFCIESAIFKAVFPRY